MIITPPSLTWTQTKLSKPMMDYLWSQIKLAKKNCKPELLGHISKSLFLPDKENKIFDLVKPDAETIGYKLSKMEMLWVNWQKKYEFNPLHAHSGHVSFVIWMKIPYNYEEEKKRPQAGEINGQSLSGCFEFVCPDQFGQLAQYQYHLSSEYEGILIVFPASLRHQVYPFYTSDEDRISISGNLT